MNFRRAHNEDVELVDACLLSGRTLKNSRLDEIVHAALATPNDEYRVALAVENAKIEIVAAYGMVAGTIGTAALYGAIPITGRVMDLLSFVAHDVQNLGAQQIVAEFPDTDEFRPYRDVLLESGYNPTGLVEDFYRDGVAMVIFTRVFAV
ncbi:MAG: hypothetical protein H0W69_06730 [Gemmatimonadaceae bacterium]|nr:hypothetical protein [Gemmatimonadaceae bacterium]